MCKSNSRLSRTHTHKLQVLCGMEGKGNMQKHQLQKDDNSHLCASSLSSESPHLSASSGVGLQIKAERFFNKPISARFLIVWPIRKHFAPVGVPAQRKGGAWLLPSSLLLSSPLLLPSCPCDTSVPLTLPLLLFLPSQRGWNTSQRSQLCHTLTDCVLQPGGGRSFILGLHASLEKAGGAGLQPASRRASSWI